ncbi:MAG: SusE domain-containing protein, partial [Muribaculaceae bacterium]|nr:SusE domain-containing protein [Muribaculaceae bacterium]
ASASIFFEWEAAHVADGSVPQYELAFYKADDTTTPIYKVTSDNTGAKPTATVSHKTLTKIMAAAGVQMGQEGTVKWGVISYSGANKTQSTLLHNLTMTRFIGFDEVPAQLFLTGAASENGENLADASAFMKPDAETFEIFTRLKGGEPFYFVADIEDAENTSYSISGDNFIEGKDGGKTVAADGIYRISLDFATASAKIRKIEGVFMRFTEFSFGSAPSAIADNNCAFEYEYQGNGVYRKETTIVTKDTGWSWDPYESRYNIYMVYEDGEASWAPTNTGIDEKPNMPLDINSDYWSMQEFPQKVGYKWKLSSSCYNIPIIATVYFNGEYGTFKHFTQVK